MGLLDTMKGVLAQYSAGTASEGNAEADFHQLAQSLDAGTLAQAVSAVMRSDQTPPFAQLVSQLFANGSGDQKAAMLKTLLASASPDQQGSLAAMLAGAGTSGAVPGTQAPGTQAPPVAGRDRRGRAEGGAGQSWCRGRDELFLRAAPGVGEDARQRGVDDRDAENCRAARTECMRDGGGKSWRSWTNIPICSSSPIRLD